MIEDGHHLQQCLKYIDLNMVRAGVVLHPREWEWSGYQELMGERQRYRLLAIDELLAKLGAASLQEFRAHYCRSIEESITRRELERDAKWTESVAVGSRTYVEKLHPRVRRNGGALEMEQVPEGCAPQSTESTWVLRETASTWRVDASLASSVKEDLSLENSL
jgi:putative transposase